ncbi:MAG TPA: alpha-2-macroglobulin [Thermoanaerobaculia bacterium]|nr:alpha-2-macroglobulin [Thermoanaerobaculia bacterium]
MANPFASLRDKIAPRLRALRQRPWQGKDVALIVLTLLLVAVSGYAFREPLAAAFARVRAGAGGETVSVFDVVVDRKDRQFVDILFDRPLGEGKVDQIIDPPPATIEPGLGGSWKWKDTNALRFQPSGGFPVASEYKVDLIPERLLKKGQVFSGDTEVVVRTDQFLVEGVDVVEEPALEGKGKVVFRGEIRFNYPVNPEVLAPKVRLDDPRAPKPVAVTLETSWENATIGFRTEAVQKEKDERTVRLVIAADMTPANGNAPLGKDFVQEIPLGSSTRLAVRGVEAQPGLQESSLQVTFSSPVSAALAEPYLKLAPEARVRLSADRNVLTITGNLQPGSTYKLTIGQGMPAADDAVLPAEYTADVELPDLEPSVGYQSEGMFLSAAGNHTVNLESVNLPRVHMAIDRVYRNNLFFLFQYGGFFDEEYGYFDEVSHALGDRLKEANLDLGGRRNQRKVTPLTLDRWVDTSQPGLYRVSVGKPDDYQAAQRWLLLTDLGLVVKKAPGELLVWVSSIRDLAPVEGAQVTLVSDQNQVLGQGRTDGSGVFRLRDAKALAKGTPYLLMVERGDDFTFLLLDTMRIDTAGLDVGGAEPPGTGYQAYLYGERDIYRPGERLEGLAVVRDGSLQIPPAMPALLRHRDPQGRELETQRVRVDDRGLATFGLDLPAYALTGHHTLELVVAEKVIGQYRFQVEEFVPDRIGVEIAPPAKRLGPGDELAYEVRGKYLFGPPAANLPVETRVRLVDFDFAPKGFEGFSFRNAERKLDDREVLATQGTLDLDGKATFRVTMPAGAPVPSSLEAMVTARVSEQGGRGVAALSRLRVDPYPYYVGLRRLGEGYPQPGQPIELEYAAVAPDGQEVASGGLRADLYKDNWNTVLRRVPGGGYRYESTRDPALVSTQAIESGKGRGRFRFAPRDFGEYRVVVTDPATRASAEVEVFVAGWGTSPWAIKNPSRLELVLDKAEYAPGETARVQVRAPFSGKLLLTVERDRVLDLQVHTMDGNTATIDVPISADYRPNSYITATLVRKVGDLEPGSAGRAFGAVPLPVDRTANRLTPGIVTPEEIRPGSELQVQVKTQPGAVVTVAAVDEGILQLIAQKTPDPFEYFYRRLALGVSSHDTFGLLLPEVRPAPPGGGEGEEGMSQYVRTEGIRRVEPVAFWSGPVTADGEGNARATFRLPDFQGALRLMAVSIDGDRFGSSQELTRVRNPLVVLPTVPRVLSFGEPFQVPVTVRNDTGRAGKVQVILSLGGPLLYDGPKAQTVEVENGRETTLYFKVRTGEAPGDARIAITASGNGEQTRSETAVPVRSDLFPVSTEQAGAAKAVTDLPLANGGSYLPNALTRELRIGPLPLVQFSGKLENLLGYPYGCIEQTVSQVFPLIYLSDLAKALEPELFDPKKGHGDPAAMVQEGVRKIATMQVPTGGFSLWPGGRDVWPWGSLYAAHFLVEARRAGHPVDNALYDGALRWVASQVKAKSAYGSDELQRAAYGLWILARAGHPDPGTMDYLRTKQAGKMKVESRSMLAAAYAAAGNPRAVQDLLANLGEVERVDRQTGGLVASTIRNRAVVLLALLDAAPNHPRIPALVDRLSRDLGETPEWTTQEESWTLLALGQLAQRQARQPAYSGSVFFNGRKLGSFGNAPVKFTIPGPGPVQIRMDPGYREGAAFYHLLTRGIPTDDAYKPASAGLEVEREYLTREGKAVDLGNVRQGDLLVVKTRVRSVSGPVQNVAIVNLLPSGLEVENPRLETTEKLPWITDANMKPSAMDLRDDRILMFANLPPNSWQTFYSLVRAVTPGEFRLPPVQAEAMYDPALRGTGERGTVKVGLRE